MEKKVLVKIECDDLDFDDYDIEDADRALVNAYIAAYDKKSDTSFRYYEIDNDDLQNKVVRYAREAMEKTNKPLVSIIVCDNDTKELLNAYTIIDKKKYAFTPTIKYGKEDFFRLKRRIDNKPPRVKKKKEKKENEREKIERIINNKKEDIKFERGMAIGSAIIAAGGLLICILNKDILAKDFRIFYGLIDATVQEASQVRLKAGLIGGAGGILTILGSLFSGISIKMCRDDKKALKEQEDKLKIK